LRSRWPRLLVRLFAFNLLLVFVPILGVLYLGTYETQLLRWQERSMVQQGRLVAAALAGTEPPTVEDAELLLTNLRQRTESRIRILDADALLLADTSRLGPQRDPAAVTDTSSDEREVRERWLYRFGALLVGTYQRFFSRPNPALDLAEFYPSDQKFSGDEVLDALAGRYGAATRVSRGGQRSVNLYSAIPIEFEGQVHGAVLVSQSTFRILASLYEIRLNLFKVFLASVSAAILLSVILAATIVRPVNRLRSQAATLLDRHGRLQGEFSGSSRRDEIGDLARALEELSARLHHHLESVESFATDLSHELKNPLASIRNASTLLAQAESAEDKERFLHLVERDVARMQHLVTQVKDVSAIEAQAEAEEWESVRLDEVLDQLIEGVRLRTPPEIQLDWSRPTEHATVLATPERLVQVFENLLDNAISFSPTPGVVSITLVPGASRHVVTIVDEGPGVPAGDLSRIFDRFFSVRPESGKHQHTGLGLAIVKAIVGSYGGAVAVANRVPTGARFVVQLPADHL